MSLPSLPLTVRAAVFCSPGSPLELRQFPRPELSQHEALVRVDCCTLCGSDLHTYLGKRTGPAPSILGHEMLGRIAEFGPDHPRRDWRGAPLAVGDRVSWAIAASCGECFFCQHELPQKCERLFKYGHESSDGNHPLSGGLAEYCHLAAGSALVRVPDELSDAVGATANCAAATAAAAIRAGGGCGSKIVLIQGAGLLGLATAAMAQSAGAAEVVVADIDETRLETARRFSATNTVNVSEPEALARVIKHVSDGRGVDSAFEMSGSTNATPQGLDVLRTGGTYVLVGAVRPVGAVALDVETVVRRMWRLQGVHNYAPDDLAAAIDFLAANHQKYPFGDLTAAEFQLDEADAAFKTMVENKAVRVAVRP
jgi:alcohol dehydrogenase